MVIEINNFGPIHSFSFDLEKDFHVVYGKNNIGKSYAISVVYIILKSFISSNKTFLPLFLLSNQGKTGKKLDSVIAKVREKANHTSSDSISFKNDFEKILKGFLEVDGGVISDIQEALENSFALENIQNKFSKKAASILIKFSDLSFSIKFSPNGKLFIDNVKFGKKCIIKIAQTNQAIEPADTELRFYLNRKELDNSIETLKSDIWNVAMTEVSYLFAEARAIYNEVYFLPASRSGIYEAMNIFSSIMVRLSQLRHVLNKKIDIPALAVPTSDYFLNLSTIKSSKITDVYSRFASEIEEKILNAEILFNEETKKLEYVNKKINLRLDLSETSSMVSEIAPIVAHLKYIINEKRDSDELGSQIISERGLPTSKEDSSKAAKILFIEEPEAHLHPEVQVELLEIFSRMLKHNIKIVLTTHSNYIFNKVNNLMIKDEINYKDAAIYHLVSTEKGSVLDEKSIPSDTGIVDENFVYTAEKLYNERLEIYKNQ